MKYLKKILLALFVFSMPTLSYSQISFGGEPRSFSEKESPKAVAINIPINFDVEDLIRQDLANEKELGTPPRTAENIEVEIDIHRDGYWTTLWDGTIIGQIRIQAPGAQALIFSYDDFFLPENVSLFIYNKDQTQVHGAYTIDTNPWGGRFSTEMILGDDIVLEVEIPHGMDYLKDEIGLNINGIGYCYNHIEPFKDRLSGPCMINVNCPEGDDWQTEKTGVVRMLMYLSINVPFPGWYNCTGTVINNTSEDLTPYLISAFHCYNYTLDEDLDLWQFYFHYESPTCETSTPEGVKSLVGCQVRSAIPIIDGSDGLLLELKTAIPEDWGIYYNGWDRRNEVVEGVGVGIHHPQGDLKKISTFNNYAEGTWPGVDGDPPGATNGFWNFQYIPTQSGHSTVEGGSSGSAMFSSEHHIVGTLTGGTSTCTNPNGWNMYGKIWYHWDQYGDSPETQMKTWLDPINSGATTLQGTYFNPTAPRIVIDNYILELEGTVDEDNPPQSILISGYNLTQDIIATVEGHFLISKDQNSWSNSIQISPNGGELYVVYNPPTYGNHNGTITIENSEIANNANIQLSANSCLEILVENHNLPNGEVGLEYIEQLNVSGSVGPYSFELISGQLPTGITFNNGIVEGTPTEDGLFSIEVEITDGYSCVSNHEVKLYIVCSVITDFPYNENFEHDGLFPACWKTEGILPWMIGRGVRPEFEDLLHAHSGEYNAVFYGSTFDGNTGGLVSPQIDLLGVKNPKLKFWYLMPSWDGDSDILNIAYKSNAHDSWNTLSTYSEPTEEWIEAEVNLPNPSQEYFIKFQGTSYYGYGIGIDNLTIESGSTNEVIPTKINDQIRFNNPIQNTLNLKWETGVNSIHIYSITGHRVLTIENLYNSNSVTINTSLWDRGLYLIKVQGETQQQTIKIIKN